MSAQDIWIEVAFGFVKSSTKNMLLQSTIDFKQCREVYNRDPFCLVL